MVKFSRDDEESVSTFMNQLRQQTVLSKPRICRVVFRNRVNMDFLAELQARSSWRVLLLGSRKALLQSNEVSSTVLAITDLSAEYNNCCRMVCMNAGGYMYS